MPVACATALKIAGAAPSIGSSPMPLAPPGPYGYGTSSKYDADRRQVHRGRHDVVGHLRVGHSPLAPRDIFVERPADPLRDTAFDLSAGEDRVDDLAHFLNGDEVVDARLPCGSVDRHFGDVDGPARTSRTRRPCTFVVPAKSGRWLILARCAQRAEGRRRSAGTRAGIRRA